MRLSGNSSQSSRGFHESWVHYLCNKRKHKLAPCSVTKEMVWKYFRHCRNGAFSSLALLTVEAANMCGSFNTWKQYENTATEWVRNVLFNDALNTFYLRLYGVRHMVKDHSDSEKGNPLPPHRLLLSINSKGSFICTIPQTG